MNKRKKTREPQYQVQFDTMGEKGPVHLGPTASHLWRSDPRHLGFLLARYKFCAKMLAGKSSVLDVGCGDGFGIKVVLQEVDSVHGIDFDPLFIEQAQKYAEHEGLNCTFSMLDITQETVEGKFDAAYSLDVIEHIPPEAEDHFMANVCNSLRPHAICIIGTPNVEAQKYATPPSAEGHVNLKSAESLKELLSRYFHNVFIFSMNDEVVHTGFYPMASYLMGVGVEVKE